MACLILLIDVPRLTKNVLTVDELDILAEYAGLVSAAGPVLHHVDEVENVAAISLRPDVTPRDQVLVRLSFMLRPSRQRHLELGWNVVLTLV